MAKKDKQRHKDVTTKSKVAGVDVTGASDGSAPAPASFADALRVRPGFVLADLDPRSTPAFTGEKADGQEALAARAGEMSGYQEQLYAEAKGGGRRSLLIVVQGMDTSGKGGIMRHVVGQMDPQGVEHTSFKAPSAEEKKHHFLWRIRRALPQPGQVGVFDRSHYEDVVAVRVRRLVDEPTWTARYDEINTFAEELVAAGTRVVKCFLHISREEQKERLLARLEDPTKHWKFNPGDLDDRALWDDFMAAYGAALSRCDTEHAPWHVVPADRKWYRNWAISLLLVEQLEEMALRWPEPAFDVAEMIERVRATP
jgi:PPK2 family polyphosphate:nucleotide phosphotransferase